MFNRKRSAIVFGCLLAFCLAGTGTVYSQTTGGGSATLGDVGDAPAIDVPSATVNDTSDSRIEIAFNATGISSPRVKLVAPNFTWSQSVSQSAGTVNLTIPEGTFGGGDLRFRAELLSGSGDRTPLATDRSQLSVHTAVNVSGATLERSAIRAGDNASVEVTLKNQGEEVDRITVAVYRKNSSETAYSLWTYRQVSVGAGSTRTVVVNATASTPGTDEISVGTTAVGTLDVTSAIEILDISLDPDLNTKPNPRITEGENATLTVSLNNTREESASRRLELYAKNESGTTILKASRNVTLAGGRQATIDLNGTFEDAGSYGLVFNGSQIAVLGVDSPVELTDYVLSDKTIGTGENVTVEATFSNPTSEDETITVSLGPGLDKRETVTVAAGGNATAVFTVSWNVPRKYPIRLDQTSPIWKKRIGFDTVFVLNDTTGTPNVTVQEAISPTEGLIVGRPGAVGAKITNTGTAAGLITLSLQMNGTTQNRTYAVEPNTTLIRGVPTKFDSTGTFNGTLNGHSVTIPVRNPVILSTNVSVVGGPTLDATPEYWRGFGGSGGVFAFFHAPFDTGCGIDLRCINATEDTVLRLNMTLREYELRVAIALSEDLPRMESYDVGPNRTKVSVWLTPKSMDNLKTPPKRPENWDLVSEDRADTDAFTTKVRLAEGDSRRFSYNASVLSDLAIATDAQLFRPPEYYPGSNGTDPRLEIRLAAPHLTEDGTLNRGYYRSFLPDSLLEKWGVSDPGELTAAYTGSENTSLTVTNVSGGMRLNLSLHYSSGTVRVTKNESTTETATPVSTVVPKTDGFTWLVAVFAVVVAALAGTRRRAS
jgi:hypothetical protein